MTAAKITQIAIFAYTFSTQSSINDDAKVTQATDTKNAIIFTTKIKFFVKISENDFFG